jgi:hypothetical protein
MKFNTQRERQTTVLFFISIIKVITFNAAGVHKKTLKMPLKRALNIQMIKYSSKAFKRL